MLHVRYLNLACHYQQFHILTHLNFDSAVDVISSISYCGKAELGVSCLSSGTHFP